MEPQHLLFEVWREACRHIDIARNERDFP